MAETPLLQRVGMRYIARRERRLGHVAAQVDVHRLDGAEQQALLRWCAPHSSCPIRRRRAMRSIRNHFVGGKPLSADLLNALVR